MSDELITQRRMEARAEDREDEARRCRRSGGWRIQLRPSATVTAFHTLLPVNEPEKIRDREGREVLLSPGRWQHIVSGHPEIEIYEREVRRAVESPTAVLPGRESDEERLYLEGPVRVGG